MRAIDYIGIASSVMAEHNFDTLNTIDFAIRHKLSLVQLYLNPPLLEERQLQLLLDKIKASKVAVVLHLPNSDQLDEQYLNVATQIVRALPEQDISVFIHHEVGWRVQDIPMVAGKRVGIENAINGEFLPRTVEEPLALARKAKSFFVFDPGRIMYFSRAESAQGIESPQSIVRYITRVVTSLKPEVDLLHLAGKSSWRLPFREAQCAFGDSQEISLACTPAIVAFVHQGGRVIIEHEDPDLALASMNYLQQQCRE